MVEVRVVGTVLVKVPAVIVSVDGGELLAESPPADEQAASATAANAPTTGMTCRLPPCPGRAGSPLMPITVAVPASQL